MSKMARRYTRKKKVQNGDEPTPKQPKKIEILAKSERQRDYLNALRRNSLIFSTGCAGTGKTYVAVSFACQLYLDRRIKQIILTRPNIAAGGKSLGFFPGERDEKMMNWMRPVLKVMEKHLGKDKVRQMLSAGEILIEPFETMRGESFENAFVLLDEAQNASYDELKMFLTRIGEDTLTVIDGDVGQTDLARDSGLRRIINIAKRQMLPYPVIEFTSDDIVRGDVCASWIKAFLAEENPAAY